MIKFMFFVLSQSHTGSTVFVLVVIWSGHYFQMYLGIMISIYAYETWVFNNRGCQFVQNLTEITRPTSFFTDYTCTLSDIFCTWHSSKTVMLFAKFEKDLWINSIKLIIWWHRSRPTLAHVMVWCLTAPSHYLNQCWFIISGDCGIQQTKKITWSSQNIN